MSDLSESLKKCRVEGNTLHLPSDYLPNYAEVRKALMNAGASYKRNTFIFKSDAKPFVDRLIGGESVNIKKEFQFFETPPDIADWVVELAEVKSSDVILEPSAGQAAIVKAINRVLPNHIVHCVELMPENRAILKTTRNVKLMEEADFLKFPTVTRVFTKIIANPPFSKNQDIAHIRKMYDCLKKGGRLVSIASKHWKYATGKKET